MVFYFVMTVVEVKICFLRTRKYYHIKVLEIENVLVTSKCIFFKMFKFSFDEYSMINNYIFKHNNHWYECNVLKNGILGICE